MPKVHSFMILPALPESLQQLDAIARNMFWSWNADAAELFKRVDSNLWTASGHNPVKLLASISQRRLEALAESKSFLHELNRVGEKLQLYIDGSTWYEKIAPKSEKPTIAYFSAEFGIHECLPVYSGGLGLLAGDHLKSASDLGVPIVGVGLLYQKGYFRQYLNIDGWQQELYVEHEFHSIPIELVRKESGRPLTVSIEYPGKSVVAQIWQVLIGRVKLYLLDTNVEANSPEDRMITATLYGGDREMRIRQEIMLGIGGLKALLAMGIQPTVCHMNEGHAAFLALERIRQLRAESNMTFEQAAEATKAGNVFTVHTPVKAGVDDFNVELLDKYFGKYFPTLGLNRKQFLGLGRVNADNEDESFKMPILALKLSGYRNGVSQLHGEVSRKMWGELWKDIPTNEVPIKAVTNGVHVKTWLCDELDSLYERYFGPNWPEEIINPEFWDNIDNIPDEEIWKAHQRYKERLIVFARNRLKAQMQRRGTYHTELNWAEEVLDPEALTIGFARRFATYKRGNLLLKDPSRLVKILTNPKCPVQLLFAGKAHPRDTEGKEIIRQIIHFANQFDVRRIIVFLEDYDINVARHLVRGVDVWLNTPRPPMEASGTSGMKAAINVAFNMSTFDGWWCEGYRPDVGWVIGSGESYDDAGYQDMVESQTIYNLLENEIVPLFYTRATDNLPRAWITRMKNSIKYMTPLFNTHRMVSEYTKNLYNPAAAQWRYLTADDMARAKALSQWKSQIAEAWRELSIKQVETYVANNGESTPLDQRYPRTNVGSNIGVKALVRLGRINPDEVSVEIYHGQVDAWGNISEGAAVRMVHPELAEASGEGEYWFVGSVPCKAAGRHGFSVRILPQNPDLADPYEVGLVLWESTAATAKVQLVTN